MGGGGGGLVTVIDFFRKPKPIDQKMDVILFKVHQVQDITVMRYIS